MTSLQRGASRRTFLKGAAATVTIVGAAPFVIARAKAAGPLTVNTWGGAWTAAETEAFFKPFTAKTGIEIKTATPVSYAKLKAQVDSRNFEWDVSNANATEIKRANGEGLIEPLDWSVLDRNNLKVPVYENGVGSIALATLILYRTDKFPNGGPQNWADFWNVDKFPGKRSLYDRSFTALSFGLLADGVATDKLYPMDVDRAFKSLDRVKKHIRVWWKQGNQSQQLIQDGEVDVIGLWSGRALNSIEKNKLPGAVAWNGAEIYNAYWYAPKGTPRKKEAMQFIDFVSQAKPLADLCKILPYGPLNPDSFQYFSEAEAKRMPTYPPNQKVGFFPDAEWLGPNLAKISERFAQWLAS